MVNVSVRNHGWGWLGLFRHPGHAHTTHYKNPAVVEAVVEGFDIRWPPNTARGRKP